MIGLILYLPGPYVRNELNKRLSSLSHYLSLSLCQLSLSVSSPLFLSVSIFLCLSICHSVSLFVSLSPCPSLALFLFPSAPLPLCLKLSKCSYEFLSLYSFVDLCLYTCPFPLKNLNHILRGMEDTL